MGFDDKGGGFHSGHTQALDLDDLDKGLDDWDKPARSKDFDKGGGSGGGWDSGGGGGGDDWDSGGGGGDWGGGDWGGGGGGGGGHTAALDISELEDGGYDAPPSRGRGGDDWDSGGGGDDWDSGGGGGGGDWGGGGGGGDDWGGGSDWGGGGGGGGHTAALDLSELDAPPKERRRRQDSRQKDLTDLGDEVRYEDSRGRGERVDKGKKSYSAGQSAKGRKDDDKVKSKAAAEAERHRQGEAQRKESQKIEVAPDAASPDGPGELAPHERTMALDLDKMRSGSVPPSPAPSPAGGNKDLPRTQALDVEELRAGAGVGGPASAPPAELAPHERTHALDLSAIQGSGGAQLPSTQALTPVAGPANGGDVEKTTMIDSAALENYRANEAASGGKLIIFVEGNDPVVFDLRPGITNIGRERSNHLVLSDPFASRKHIRIKKDTDGSFDVKDQGSDNRTLINGVLAGEHVLSHGDDIQVGSTVMRFVLGEPTEADYQWPEVHQPPSRSGHTAAVSAITDEDALPPAEGKKKTSKLLIAVLVFLILGTVLMAAAVVAFVVWGDAILG